VDYRKWESVLDYTHEHNMAFIPWYPMNAGNVAAMNELKKVAADIGATPQQVALSWLLHRSNNILLIPGTSKVKHLEENMHTLNIHLSADQLRGLDEIGKETIS
jgi:pyridoxine 4-dehydrogenase